MRIQENMIDSKKVLHIYVSTEETNNPKLQEQIKQIREENSNVVVFISGNMEISLALKQMVECMKNNVGVNF